MKYLIKKPSSEVAMSSCFLQNAAYRLWQSWKKRMLFLMVSMLCASCGGSGVPTESGSTSGLNNLNTDNVAAITASDSIIGPGHSGYGLAEAQVPNQVSTLAAAPVTTSQPLWLAAAETEDLNAPGQSVSTALQSVGTTVTVSEPPAPPETVNTDESNTQDAELSPEEILELEAFEAELAALEAELAALPPIAEVITPVAEPEVITPVAEEDQDGNDGTSGTVVKSVTYDSIEANGLGNGTYPTDDHYLAEFLYQNPDVCFWEQDKSGKTITSVKTPVPPEDSVYLPSPTGGDDTSMLESFIKKNAGKSLVGQGTYKVKTLDIEHSVDIYGMAMVPASGAKQMVRISAPDVRIFNSPIDGKNTSSLAFGFNVENGAHRFVLVNSAVKNIYHKNNADASAVFIRGANDFYIVCNEFDNIINDTRDKSNVARANSVWAQGRKTHNLSGGLIANNYANNHQSNGKSWDAEFFTIQGYKSVSEKNPVRIFANRAYNAGKRMTKNQEGNALILSNYVEWNTKTGPVGRRKLQGVFTVHFGDNVIVNNNRVSISAEGHFAAIFLTDAASSSIVQDNIRFDNNDIELKDNRDPNANSGPEFLRAAATGYGLNAVGFEATNSSAVNNTVYGTGSLRSYYFFRDGYDDRGGRFKHENNDISVPFYQREYR